MFILHRMIDASVILWLFIMWIFVWTKHGVLCTNDFGKPITDPCCENVRVHYRQRTVYEILSLQHDDLRRGINCFQRVCPSQFPAFYRVMYVGGFRGASVSFAVCSDGEHVDLNQQDGSKSSSGIGVQRRSVQQRKIKSRFRKNFMNMRNNNYQNNIMPRKLNSDLFVFKHINSTYINPNSFGRDAEHDTEYKTNDTFQRNFSRRKREPDTSRTIFEIPEPRPSIVYTLTGVCFCLRVQSSPQLSEDEKTIHDNTYNFAARNRNSVNLKQDNNSLFQESHLNISRFNENPNKNVQNGCASGNCKLAETAKNRIKRSKFLDSFMKAVLESREKAGNQSADSAGPNVSPSTHPEFNKFRTTHPHGTSGHTSFPKRHNTFINTTKDSTGTRHRRRTTLKYQNNLRNHEDPALEETRARALNEGVSDDGEENGDDTLDPEDFKDKLVVFASFSHDVHFIGSISMTVSVASSCRSNLPLSPEGTNNTSNDTATMGPNPGDSTTTKPVAMTTTSTASDIGGNHTALKETTQFEKSSTSTLPTTAASIKDETIPKSMVEEVPGTSNDENDDGNNDDGRVDVLLVWQISAIVVFTILLVLLLVFLGTFCRRRRRRKQKERYSSLTPQSTLERPLPPPPSQPANDQRQPEANISTVSGILQPYSDNAVTTTAPDAIMIPRTIQAISRNEPSHVINIGTDYPMHIRLRSLSAAAEAARLRGQEALRMLNNEKENDDEEAENTNNNNNKPLVAMKPILSPHRMGNVSGDIVANDGYSRASNQMVRNLPNQNNNRHSPKQTFNPTIVVSEGSHTREFDLGQFAVYRNDIMLKLRRCGLRTGRRRRNVGTGSNRDYDNDENDGEESVYACYAGGETDI